MKQCTCGRSKTYPYCDQTHKIKKEQSEENK
jgi:CDGSH-type Zn-finger protein